MSFDINYIGEIGDCISVIMLGKWSHAAMQPSRRFVLPIYGQWRNPAMRRCDRKIAYGSWRRAESRAQKVSGMTGELIIAYQCYDCGKFHIGHADESQKIVRQTKEHTLQVCCPNCKGPIPPDRRAAAETHGSSIMYCSNQCHNAWDKKRREARLRWAWKEGRESATE